MGWLKARVQTRIINSLTPLPLSVLQLTVDTWEEIEDGSPLYSLRLASIASGAIPSLRFFCYQMYFVFSHPARTCKWWRIVHDGEERRLEDVPCEMGDRMMEFLEDEANFDDACRIHGEHSMYLLAETPAGLCHSH